MKRDRWFLILPFILVQAELFALWLATPEKFQPHLLLHPLDSTIPVLIVAALMMGRVSRLDFKLRLSTPALSLHLLAAGILVWSLRSATAHQWWTALGIYGAYGMLLLSGLSLLKITAPKSFGRSYFLGAMAVLTFYPLVAQLLWKPMVTLAGSSVRGLLGVLHLSVESAGACQGLVLKTVSVTTSITSQSNGFLGVTFAVATLSVLLAWERPTVTVWRIFTGYLLAAGTMWVINILRIAAILSAGPEARIPILTVSGLLYALGFCAVYLIWLKPTLPTQKEVSL